MSVLLPAGVIRALLGVAGYFVGQLVGQFRQNLPLSQSPPVPFVSVLRRLGPRPLTRLLAVSAVAWSLASVSLRAYEMPVLPPLPALPATGAVDSVPLDDSGAFAEVKMDFPIAEGPAEPTWPSIASQFPMDSAQLRADKFGIWVHFGPQAAGESGDWYARHLYKPGTSGYQNHLTRYGHPSEVGFKEVLRDWNPTQLDPAALVSLYQQAGARFLLIQGVHHDQFDMWNSRYQPWNSTRLGAERDFLGEWSQAARAADISYGITFHHEYSWWWWQTAFNADGPNGPKPGVPYDGHLTLADGVGKWWEGLDPRLLYGIDLRQYQGVSAAASSAWSPPPAGIFGEHLEFAHWYNTWWALRMIDAIEQYDPDFIYTDGTSSQPFSGSGTGTGYKSDAMQRVIAHLSNRALERRGEINTHAVVKFHSGDRLTTTFENNFPSGIKSDQPWIGEVPVGDWFYGPGFNYNPGMVIRYLLECVSRDGAAAISIPQRPDGSLDPGCVTMLQQIGQWMTTNSVGIYGSRAWVKHAEGARTLPHGKLGNTQANYAFTTSDFRFTVGADGCLYVYCMTVPAPGTQLRIASLGAAAGLLAAPIEQVSLLGGAGPLTWSQESDALVITCPASMPFQTAVSFKVGPAATVGIAPPGNVEADSLADRVNLAWRAPAGATFSIARGTDGAGPFTTLASGVTTPGYSDTSVAPGTLYYYTVIAHANGMDSNPSAPVAGIAIGGGTPTWTTADIGSVGAAGSLQQSGDVLVIEGSGADIWGNSDEFRFVYQAMTGDCAVTARIVSQQNTSGWAKAGVMVRQSLDANSPYALNFVSPSNGVAFQRRTTVGGAAGGVSEKAGVAAPQWVRLLRSGNTFSAYHSADGVSWTLQNTTTVTMTGTVYVGLAVCGNNDGALNQVIATNLVVGPLPPPDRPTQVAGFGGDTQASLIWTASTGAASYTVQRATTAGGPYATVASGLSSTLHTQTGLTNGTTYHYVVLAVNTNGTSAPSVPVSVTPAPPTLPAGWAQQDVGAVAAVGGGGQSDGSFLLTGSGADVWFAEDEIHYAYVPVSGDSTITARVRHLQNVHPNAKGGVMIRESLTTGSAHAMVNLTPSAGVEFIRRATTGGATAAAATAGLLAPHWVRLTRVGGTFTAYQSPDGVTWTMVGSPVTVTMGAAAYMGLAVNSHLDGTLCQAWFDQVTTTPASLPPSAPTGLVATAGGARVDLAWSADAAATSYTVKRAIAAPAGPYATIASGLTTAAHADTGLDNGTTYYYVVTAANAFGEGEPSAPVSARPLSAFMRWRLKHFGVIDATGASADEADPDGDGRANLAEYATGSSPLLSDAGPLTVAGISEDGDRHLTLAFDRQSPAAADTVVEASTELAGWTPIASLPLGFDTWSGPAMVTEVPAGDLLRVTVTDPVPLSAHDRRFLRVRFTAQ